jgi:hypothetical protein
MEAKMKLIEKIGSFIIAAALTILMFNLMVHPGAVDLMKVRKVMDQRILMAPR